MEISFEDRLFCPGVNRCRNLDLEDGKRVARCDLAFRVTLVVLGVIAIVAVLLAPSIGPVYMACTASGGWEFGGLMLSLVTINFALYGIVFGAIPLGFSVNSALEDYSKYTGKGRNTLLHAWKVKEARRAMAKEIDISLKRTIVAQGRYGLIDQELSAQLVALIDKYLGVQQQNEQAKKAYRKQINEAESVAPNTRESYLQREYFAPQAELKSLQRQIENFLDEIDVSKIAAYPSS